MFATAACAAALAIPVAGASAGSENSRADAAKACAEMKRGDRAAFNATYGSRHAMRACIRADVTVQEFRNAAQICRDERSASETAFMNVWGTNEPNENSRGARKNAFGKCVSATAKTLHEEPPST